jgi:hypothetical protein
MKLKNTILPIFMIFNSEANTHLASKRSLSNEYDYCHITKNTVTREISHNQSGKLVETTILNSSLNNLRKDSQTAIDNIQRDFQSKFSANEIYRVQNSTGNLDIFFSRGINEVQNSSNESKNLIKLIDSICEKKALDFKIIGDFNIYLKIGNTKFIDSLSIFRKSNPYMKPGISGKYTVPNSFSSNLSTLDYRNGKFSFVIRVIEGSQDYFSVFEGSMIDKDNLSGKAYTLPDRKLLGHFTGRRM